MKAVKLEKSVGSCEPNAGIARTRARLKADIELEIEGGRTDRPTTHPRRASHSSKLVLGQVGGALQGEIA